MKFENRVAVVTGGAGRIGLALIEKLCEQNVAVALVDIAAEKAEAAASSFREKGGNVRAYKMDVQNADEVKAVCAKIIADFGHIDILVNNAGVWLPSLFEDMEDDLWEKMIDLNLNGVYRVTKPFLANMLENGYGRIINLGSIAGEVGLPKYSGYSTAKAGVIMLTKVMAMELAKKNITVNSVSPGMIGDDKGAPTNLTWMGKWGGGDDVANLIMFLASDDTDFITGVDYGVDGGRVLGPHGNSL